VWTLGDLDHHGYEGEEARTKYEAWVFRQFLCDEEKVTCGDQEGDETCSET